MITLAACITRNNAMMALFGVSLVLAGLSWPSPFPQIFTRQTPATFVFTLDAHRSAGDSTITLPIARGLVSVNARGGLSVDNPIDMSVTLNIINGTYLGKPYILKFDSATFKALGAYTVPVTNDGLNFPTNAEIPLTLQDSNTLSATKKVQYFRSGDNDIQIDFKNGYIALSDGARINVTSIGVEEVVQIDSAQVTVSSDNGAITLALTFVVIGISFLTLRKEE